MAYNVNFTDSVNKGSITVEENSPNDETSVTLVGRNLSDYGKIVNENFLHLLENFANSSPPLNPVEGQLWYDSTTNIDQLKIYDGAQWVSAGGLNKAGTQPEAEVSTIGDLWIDTSNQQLYLYSGSGWILVGPEYSQGASTGTRFENIVTTGNLENPVVTTYVNDVPMVIVSQSDFKPKQVIPGFETIKTGVNISSAGKIYGPAQQAETLIVQGGQVPGSDFARLSVTNIFERQMRIRNNQGISLGETETLGLTVNGTNVRFVNKSNDGNIDFNVANDITGIRIVNDGKVGILNQSPQEALDVTGNIQASGNLKINSLIDSTDINDGSIVTLGGAAIGKNLNVGASVTAQGTVTTQHVMPQAVGSWDIGTSDNKFNEIYAATINATLIRGSLIGDISGSAASAAKINSTTNFSITGDMTTTEDVVFDGQVGGNTKAFNVVLADEYFTGKAAYTDTIDQTEQVLIRKTASTGSQDPNTFYRTTINDITSLVPTFAVGMVMPFAGNTPPPGWLTCDGDGSLLRTGQYAELFGVIGTTYGTQTPNTFSLPDFRGRTALGYRDNVGRVNPQDEDRVFDDPAANILGASGGTAKNWIRVSNLPEHEHNLIGDAGNQYYAISNSTGLNDSGATGLPIIGSVTGTGITISGGIRAFAGGAQDIDGNSEKVGDKFDTTTPFVTVNYIIYTGVIQ
jgi:microcystin-dependent protein